jgi:hypothetical protein
VDKKWEKFEFERWIFEFPQYENFSFPDKILSNPCHILAVMAKIIAILNPTNWELFKKVKLV